MTSGIMTSVKKKEYPLAIENSSELDVMKKKRNPIQSIENIPEYYKQAH